MGNDKPSKVERENRQLVLLQPERINASAQVIAGQFTNSNTMVQWIDPLPTLPELAGGTVPTSADGRTAPSCPIDRD